MLMLVLLICLLQIDSVEGKGKKKGKKQKPKKKVVEAKSKPAKGDKKKKGGKRSSKSIVEVDFGSFCVDPGYIDRGTRTEPAKLENGGFAIGSVLNFSCEKGFRLKNGKSRTCGQGGKWSGPQPRCEHPKIKSCVDPGPVTNGMTSVDEKKGGQKFKEGDKIQYSCKPDYLLAGTHVRLCQRGAWTGHKPQCKHMYDTTLDGTFGPGSPNGIADLAWWAEQYG